MDKMVEYKNEQQKCEDAPANIEGALKTLE